MEKNIVTSEGSALCPVNSYNEWDLLEEVIVGVVDGAAFPPYHIVLEATMPPDQLPTFRANAGKPFPAEQIAMAKNELEEFVHILEGEGVTVRRPLPADQQQYGAPGWTSTGLYNAMPRDVEKGLAAGFFRYLIKPINIDEFTEAINSTMAFLARRL